MIGQVCENVKNYFIHPNPEANIHTSNYTVTNGQIGPVPFLRDGQYYRIVGSIFNDGVYQRGVDDLSLVDEEFFGAVWAMRVPPAFVQLVSEMDAWKKANAAALSGPYQSESFGGYSYSKGTSSSGGAWTVFDQFESRLRAFRRLSVL